MSKIPVYFMPGMAASSLIFERIKLPSEEFEMIFMEWEIPIKDEKLAHYAKRMCAKVKHKKPVLIGVSFGGIIVQEMKKFLDVKKVIIISSIKSNLELPEKFIFGKKTKAYKLLPTNMLQHIEKLTEFSFGKTKKRLELYAKYLQVRDAYYLDWAIDQILNWEQIEIDKDIIQIHGDADRTFPIKYITNPIVIKGGNHMMILLKYKWFNENLPKIIIN
jgi:predicted esterase YcpF (UPF0227 family)